MSTELPNKKNRKFWYLNGNLYEILRVNRPADIVWCKKYIGDDEFDVQLPWQSFKRNREPALTTGETAKILNRSVWQLYIWLSDGTISKPQWKPVPLPPNIAPRITNRSRYWWSKENVLEAHTALVERGTASNFKKPLPNRAEILAVLNGDPVQYIKRGDEYIQVWKENDW